MDCYQITEKILLHNLTHKEAIHYEKKEPSMTKILLEENALPHIIKNRKSNPRKSEYIADLYDSFSYASILLNIDVFFFDVVLFDLLFL